MSRGIIVSGSSYVFDRKTDNVEVIGLLRVNVAYLAKKDQIWVVGHKILLLPPEVSRACREAHSPCPLPHYVPCFKDRKSLCVRHYVFTLPAAVTMVRDGSEIVVEI